ncbi:hypothetical protein BURPSS13_V0083 [Burkholderia pseudomallei S13]|nr:hypothetical protein BURPSS13_V0083 [Burkholderia pseudomallei S13]EDU11823.1 hypothetical protein BURPS1655_H0079 [Burkholderia pseudomallei 1655]
MPHARRTPLFCKFRVAFAIEPTRAAAGGEMRLGGGARCARAAQRPFRMSERDVV